MTSAHEFHRVALLSPYSGCNLGDGAIQDGVMENLRNLRPEIVIALITADVKYTEKLHGVTSFPLTGLNISGYSTTLWRSQLDHIPTTGAVKSSRPRLLSVIRKSPILYRTLKLPYALSRMLLKILPVTAGEVLHIIRAYLFIRQCSELVISGGGQLDDYWGGAMGHPYTLFKWTLLAKIAKTKVIFLSVGMGQLEHRLSRAYIRLALRNASYRSYRDAASKERSEMLGFMRGDPVCPDLAFSYTPRAYPKPKSKHSTTTRTVGISPIAYLSPNGWPRKDARFFESYLQTIQRFADELLSLGYNITLFTTDSPDNPVMEELFERLVQSDSSLATRVTKNSPASVDDLFACLRGVDVVIASRLHGIILSHIAEKATLAVSYDLKVATYMQAVQQTEHCIDIHAITSTDLMRSFILLCEKERDLQIAIRHHRAAYRKALSQQYHSLFTPATPGAAPTHVMSSQVGRPSADA